MIFISLGNSCKVRESINRFNGSNQATNVFDWVVSNFSSVVKVFNAIEKYQEDALFHENKFVNRGIYSTKLSNLSICHKEMQFQSLHDITSIRSYENQKNEFVEKYRRRSKRLREIVVNEISTIHFFHFIFLKNIIPTIEETYLFLVSVQNMRKNKPFFLHILVPPELCGFKEQINKIVITQNVKIHYMKSNPKIDPVQEQRQDLNWEEIYKSIKN